MALNNLSGFKSFFEYASMTRPDQRSGQMSQSNQQAFGHLDKDGTMDSISATASELGVPEKDMGGVPVAGGNIQIGHKIMMGASSMEILEITPTFVKVRIMDDGNKRFVQKPGGLYTNNTPPQEQIKYIPRAYFVKMADQQYGGASGVQAGAPGGGMGGGLPMM